MSTIKKAIFAILTLVAALSAAACSSPSALKAEEWASELEKAGFSDPVLVAENDEAIVMMATAGECRLRFVADKKPMRLFVTIPNSPIKEEGSFIGDPSLSLLKRDKRFAACFSEEKQS